MNDEHTQNEINGLRIRLGDMEKTYAEIRSLIDMREERSKDIHDKVDKIFTAIMGEGKKDDPGLITRIDRLEQIDETRKWVWSTVLLLAISEIWHWLIKPR